MSPSNPKELHAFVKYTESRMRDPEFDLSLEECIRHWRECEETINDIIAGQIEFEAGLCVPLEDVIHELRAKLEQMT